MSQPEQREKKATSSSRAKSTTAKPDEKPADEIVFKVVFVGPSDAGKSSLVHSITQDKIGASKEAAADAEHFATVGVDFSSTVIHINKPTRLNLKLQMHDCGGRPNYAPTEDDFGSILQNANAVVCCYDVRNHHSFNKAREEWLPLVEKHTRPWASDSEEAATKAQFDSSCFFFVGLHADQLRRDGEDPSTQEEGGPKKEQQADEVDLGDMELELDEDLDPAFTNPCGFPPKGSPVTQSMIQELVESSPFGPKGNFSKQLNSKAVREVRELSQSVCSNLLRSYKKRRDALQAQREAQKEKKKQDAVAAAAAAAAAVAAVREAPAADDAYSPKGGDDEPAETKPKGRGGATEGTKKKDRNLDKADDVPEVNPEKKRRSTADSKGCCAGGCTVS